MQKFPVLPDHLVLGIICHNVFASVFAEPFEFVWVALHLNNCFGQGRGVFGRYGYTAVRFLTSRAISESAGTDASTGRLLAMMLYVLLGTLSCPSR